MDQVLTVLFLVIVVAAIMYRRGANLPGMSGKESIDPDISSRNLAINSVTGKLWMKNGRDERVLDKQDIHSYIHQWTEVKGGSLGVKVVGIPFNLPGGGRISTKNHQIVFTIRDLKAPRFVVNFDTPEEGQEWNDRLEMFLSM